MANSVEMVTKHEFVKRIAAFSEGAVTQRDVMACMEAMSAVVAEIVKEQKGVKIGDFVTISGKLIPEHDTYTALTKQTVHVKDRIAPKAKFSSNFKRDLNNLD